ncbi:MAG: type II toxin-antitoxin system RelE family toxin [Thermoproteota archaeon]
MEYYRILLKKSVDKDLKRIDSSQIPRIIEAIKELAANPFSSNARKLRSTENFYRLRVGDYRVVYQIDFKDKTIIVHYIRHRRSAY